MDIACGAGYGSHLLASQAKSVVGIDISQDVISYAKEHYRANNLEFLEGTAYNIPYERDSFDVIVSFETIEHLKYPLRFLLECKRVLKPDGTLIISTPNKDVSAGNNPYHIKEYDGIEYDAMLSDYFDKVVIYGQRDVNVIWRMISKKIVTVKELLNIEKRIIPQTITDEKYPVGLFYNGIKKSVYMVAVCDKF